MKRSTWAFVLVGALIGAECNGQPVTRFVRRTFGLMPLEITVDPEVKVLGGSERLGYLHGVIQRTPGDGPQAAEGYVMLDHVGDVQLAIGVIGNVEQAGSGHVKEVRSLQAGGVVTGPGVVDRWSSLALFAPRSAGGGAATNVTEANYILFDNGWRIRPDGDRLLLCNPTGSCREF